MGEKSIVIKIIKAGDKKREVCISCSCIFTYEKEDVKSVQSGMNEYEHTVTCPCCGFECRVSPYGK